MSLEPMHVSLVPEQVFFSFMGEIHALPRRKRSQWSGLIQDTNGIIHRVHYINGALVYNKQSKWITLRPDADYFLAEIVGYDSQEAEEYYRRLAETPSFIALKEATVVC